MKFAIIALVGAAQAIRMKSDPILSSAGPAPYPQDGHPYGEFYKADYDKFPGTQDFAPKYARKMPENFENLHDDDMFMHSMIKNYAIEGKNENGTPNGRFYLDRDAGFEASKEVVHTHLHLDGQKLDDYLLHNF